MQDMSDENLILKLQGFQNPKLVPNGIFDAEALEKPLESLSERSWALFERSWTALEALLDALGAESTPV